MVQRITFRIGLALALGTGSLLTLFGQSFVGSRPPRPTPRQAVPALPSPTAQPLPPFGEIEYEKLVLQPDNFQAFGGKIPRVEKWVFAGCSREQLADLFNSCGLTANQKAFFLDTNQWETLTNGFAITPTDQVVLSLSPAACQRLFPLLGRDPANYYQHTPFRFPIQSFDECFAGSGLPAPKVEMIRRLTYTNWGQLCFCAPEHFRAPFSANEFQRLLKVLYRVPTFTMRLRVRPDSDLDALTRYWAPGERACLLRPLLEALARNPNGGVISISKLLPGFAQLRLYTYPDPVSDPAAAQQDCFYSALNFVNDTPDKSLLDDATMTRTLRTRYAPVSDAWAFGDLFLLTDSAGNGIHCCVYLADDVVFTKNGSTFLQPWVLMKVPGLLACYASDTPVKVLHLRRKPAEPGLQLSSVVPH